jgi:hypothetical protein
VISVFVEDRQLISCQNSVIMGRAAAPARQLGQNGHRRPRPGSRDTQVKALGATLAVPAAGDGRRPCARPSRSALLAVI